jgi:hypothetical protein
LGAKFGFRGSGEPFFGPEKAGETPETSRILIRKSMYLTETVYPLA